MRQQREQQKQQHQQQVVVGNKVAPISFRRIPFLILMGILVGAVAFFIIFDAVRTLTPSPSSAVPFLLPRIPTTSIMEISEVPRVEAHADNEPDERNTTGRLGRAETHADHKPEKRNTTERTGTNDNTILDRFGTSALGKRMGGFLRITLSLDNKLLWCPNHKAGSTSIHMSVLEPTGLVQRRGKFRCISSCPNSVWTILNKGDDKAREAVRAAPSFTVVRNPWDRLRSCYKDKIVRRKFFPSDKYPDGHPNEADRLERKKGPTMTFPEFVEHVEKYPSGNSHWMPHSKRCLFAADGEGHKFRYDHVIRIEDGLFEKLEEVFGRYGLPFPESVRPKNVKGKASGTSGGQAARDRALREFYAGAATPAMPMEALVERVGKIYDSDVHSHNYSFPWQA